MGSLKPISDLATKTPRHQRVSIKEQKNE